MRYKLICIGQLKRGYAAEGCHMYAERLKGFAKLETAQLKPSKAQSAAERQTDESGRLLGRAEGYLIALDERGKQLRSSGFADLISRLEAKGISQLSLLIGGADGHNEGLKERADLRFSLSALTLPHELARLLLLEQLYRAETIRAGHPYHRE